MPAEEESSPPAGPFTAEISEAVVKSAVARAVAPSSLQQARSAYVTLSWDVQCLEQGLPLVLQISPHPSLGQPRRRVSFSEQVTTVPPSPAGLR